jgi:hypothetical protein
VGWTKIETAVESNTFADAIAMADRPYSGLTAPGDAITFAVNLFSTSGCMSKSKVIDISTDGEQNDGLNPVTARDGAENQNITINALVILGQVTVQYAQENLITEDGFVVAATNFSTFSGSVRNKILLEVRPPATCATGVRCTDAIAFQALGTATVAACDALCTGGVLTPTFFNHDPITQLCECFDVPTCLNFVANANNNIYESTQPTGVSNTHLIQLCVVFCLLSAPCGSAFYDASCLVLSYFFRVHPGIRLFMARAEACRHFSAEHHTLVGRALRSYALEPSPGLCGSNIYMPVQIIVIVAPNLSPRPRPSLFGT